MFCFGKDSKITDCEPGVTRKVLAHSEELMMCEINFQTGAKGNVHSHEHLQITYIAEGEFEFTIDNETKVVKKGDSVYMPSNSVHGVVCIKEGTLIDVFNPMRKDFV